MQPELSNEATIPPSSGIDDTIVPDAFARLRLGETVYTIGEDSSSQLYFQSDDLPQWHPLNRTLEDGWHEIGATILISTRDALHDYLRMHMIQLTPDDAPEGETRYDVGGFVWDLRRVSDDAVAVRFPFHDWRTVQVGALEPKHPPREFAIAVFSAVRPDLGKSMADNVHAWAKRLASGAVVTPLV